MSGAVNGRSESWGRWTRPDEATSGRQYLRLVEGDNAEGQAVRPRRGKSRRRQLLRESLMGGKRFDGTAQVVVRPAITGHQSRHPGKQVAEVEKIKGSEPAIRLRELEHKEMPALAQDASHLAERAAPIRHVAQAEGHRDGIKAGIRQGEIESVSLSKHDIRKRTRGGCLFDFRLVEHGLAEVHAHNGGGRRQPAAQREGHISAAGREVEHVSRLGSAHGFDEAAAPPEINSTTQQAVREVIATRDAGEHGIDGNGVRHGEGRTERQIAPKATSEADLRARLGPRRVSSLVAVTSLSPPVASAPDWVALAARIATEAHAGQVRRDGITPYVKHPESVAARVAGDPRAEAVAWLHDVLEDTSWTASDLRREGLPPEVVDAVVLLTKADGGDYGAYLHRVRANPLACRVKIADMLANLADRPTDRQIAKYAQGLLVLTGTPPLPSPNVAS